MPEIVALGEPLVEFAGEERGRLGSVAAFRRGWGGDTSNFIVAVARLGGSCGYVTRLGGDEFGRSFLELWRREGVDTSHVIVEPEGCTGIYFIAMDEGGQHSFTYYRAGSAASRLQPSDLTAEALGAARIFHTSGITQAISASAAAAADAAIALARAGGLTVSFDANVRPRLQPVATLGGIIERSLGQADIAFLSTEDAAHLYGPLPPEAVVERVIAGGPPLVVLKQGAAGCLVATSDGTRLEVPGWRVQAVDATGAGDAFDAGFLVEWLRGAPLEQAAGFANAVGALTTLGPGAVGPIPTRAQVQQFLGRVGTRVE